MTTLYRHWSVNDELLYVGIAYDERERRKQHRREATWWSAVHRVSIENYSTRQDAEHAEAVAINVEQPLFNIAKVVNRSQIELAQGLRSSFRRGAEYNPASPQPFTTWSMFTRPWSESALAAQRSARCSKCDALPQWTARCQWTFVSLCSHHAITEWVYAPTVHEQVSLFHYAGLMWLRAADGLQYLRRIEAGA